MPRQKSPEAHALYKQLLAEPDPEKQLELIKNFPGLTKAQRSYYREKFQPRVGEKKSTGKRVRRTATSEEDKNQSTHGDTVEVFRAMRRRIGDKAFVRFLQEEARKPKNP